MECCAVEKWRELNCCRGVVWNESMPSYEVR